MDDSGFMCDSFIDAEAKLYNIETNFNEEKVVWKIKNFYISLAFLIIPIALSISARISCCLIKYFLKEKYMFPFMI